MANSIDVTGETQLRVHLDIIVVVFVILCCVLLLKFDIVYVRVGVVVDGRHEKRGEDRRRVVADSNVGIARQEVEVLCATLYTFVQQYSHRA